MQSQGDNASGREAERQLADLLTLSGRVAVVTGGTGLYGQPMCRALAEAGAHVAVASRSLSNCERYAEELRSQGFRASGHRLDLTEEASVEEFCDGLLAERHRIDILVNNSVWRQGSDLMSTNAEDWRSTSTVNSLGLFLITRRVSDQMVQQGAGSIINISSIYGVVGPDFSIYAGTDMTMPAFYSFDKGGMIGFTRYLACRLARHGVRVNCISPGGLRDPSQPAAFVQAYEGRVPLGRLARAEDIKGAVAFLASDASSYVTGINLPVDGGWTAH
jgi:NAD(P)-dependent dehydrogenase (short-subunit alcohol dehydrogenase family)